MVYWSHMDKDTKDILETVNFIKDHMVTKKDFDEAVRGLDNKTGKIDHRLTAVESKIGGIHNRLGRAVRSPSFQSVARRAPRPGERTRMIGRQPPKGASCPPFASNLRKAPLKTQAGIFALSWCGSRST